MSFQKKHITICHMKIFVFRKISEMIQCILPPKIKKSKYIHSMAWHSRAKLNEPVSATQCSYIDDKVVIATWTYAMPVTVRIQKRLTHKNPYTNILLAAWVTRNPLPHFYITRVRKGDDATLGVPPPAPCDTSHLTFCNLYFAGHGTANSNVPMPRLE
jgi:hypothetical protein